jgi:DNA repair exonuclease SbcCD ATPase subunit
LPPPIWKTLGRPNRPIKLRGPEPIRFGPDRALIDCGALIATRPGMAFEKASIMTDPSTPPEAPDVAETVNFLRRFAGMMSNGNSAAYLHRAADLLETLTARVIAASDEDDLWRYKYETLSRHADALEAECGTLKHDIEGHLDITSALLTERDALGVRLQAREAEFSELRDTLNRERGELATRLKTNEDVVAGLGAAYDHERDALNATLQARGEECDQLRRALEREREDDAAKRVAGEAELSELQARLKAREDELAAFGVASHREHDALKEKIAALEAKRAELRSAFDRISYLRNQTVEQRDRADGAVSAMPGPEAETNPPPAQQDDQASSTGETNAVVPKTALRQARAQFEYLARQFIPLGDIASQVMCELGAYNMDLALVAGQQTDHLPVGEVARSILAPAGST